MPRRRRQPAGQPSTPLPDVPTETCPLCEGLSPVHATVTGRVLHRCPCCALVFVPAAQHLPLAQEIARYRLHQNRIEDAGYVAFLRPVVDLLLTLCPPTRTPPPRILDYGSGPSPVLVELLGRAGYQASEYDPHFAPTTPLDPPFDAVVSTETFEHFRSPKHELDRLVALLPPGAPLIVMTSLCDGIDAFATWHYAKDHTHIAFYAARTFAFIAATWPLDLLEIRDNRLIVLRRRQE